MNALALLQTNIYQLIFIPPTPLSRNSLWSNNVHNKSAPWRNWRVEMMCGKWCLNIIIDHGCLVGSSIIIVLTALEVFISLTVPESRYSIILSSCPALAALKKAVFGSVWNKRNRYFHFKRFNYFWSLFYILKKNR